MKNMLRGLGWFVSLLCCIWILQPKHIFSSIKWWFCWNVSCIYFFRSLSYEMLWLWFNAYFKSVKIWVLRFIRLPLNTPYVCGDAKCSIQEHREKKMNRMCVYVWLCAISETVADVCKAHCGCYERKNGCLMFGTQVHGVGMEKVIQTSLKNVIFFLWKVSIECSNKSHTFLYTVCCESTHSVAEYSMKRDFAWKQIPFFPIDTFDFGRDIEIKCSEWSNDWVQIAELMLLLVREIKFVEFFSFTLRKNCI